MRRTALAVAALLLAASPVLAAGQLVVRGVQDVSGFHYQSYWDESGTGAGPFDPVYYPFGGSIGGTGGAVYGSTAPGSAPSGNGFSGFLNGFLDAGGLFRNVSPTTALPVAPPPITPVRTLVSVAASSTQLVAAKTNRRALQIACDGTSAVGISQTGATLTANTLAGGADTVIPASAANAYIPPFGTQSAITAYGTSTAQNCVVTEWLQ